LAEGERESERADLPALLVASDLPAGLAMRLAGEARDLCRLVWLIDDPRPPLAAPLVLLSRLGTGLSWRHGAGWPSPEELLEINPAGITVFDDRSIPGAARLAAALGLRFHSPETATRLVDKHAQRCALESAGIPVPRHVVLERVVLRDAVDEVVRQAQLASASAGLRMPAVLKPRFGTASRNTFFITDLADLGAVLSSLPDAGREIDLLLEEYLPGPRRPVSGFADYVSVETVVAGGEPTHVAITGRQPPAAPFRETGLFVPSDLAPGDAAAVLDLAGTAAVALGVENGVLHTEVKMTPDGPRVLEVNGRAGGAVPELVEAAGIGVSLTRAAMCVALGRPWALNPPAPASRVAFKVILQPPLGACEVLAVDGLAEVETLPEVRGVYLNRPPGSSLDWRRGFDDFVVQADGTVRDHEELQQVQQRIEAILRIEYRAAPGQVGRPGAELRAAAGVAGAGEADGEASSAPQCCQTRT
jgi:glutathione synthase/RimK-type ligase-like ATP-grasp enzyme